MEAPSELVSSAPLASRAWYSASISEFLQSQPDTIVGRLAQHSGFSLLSTQTDAWLAQIALLQERLVALNGAVFLEFNIPRMGRRIHAQEQSAAGRVRECYDGLERAVRGGEVSIELERLALGALQQIEQIHLLGSVLRRPNQRQTSESGSGRVEPASNRKLYATKKETCWFRLFGARVFNFVHGSPPGLGSPRLPSGWRTGDPHRRGRDRRVA